MRTKIAPGTRLGHYEIQTLIGTGGMGEIAGMSWWDVNGNTWQDNPVSEPGQAGWTIELSCGGTVIATAVTGPGGTYAFGDLNAGLYDGTYLVCEVVQSGWRLTLPMTPRPCSGGFVWIRDGLLEGPSR